MNKFIKLIPSNNFFSLYFFPFILLIFWFICSLLFNNHISFSVLEYKDDTLVFKENYKGKLYKGKKIVGEFKAKENYLGIIELRFKDFVKPDFRGEDVLSFKLKEKGDKEYYYINNYRSGSLEKQLLYPFGFPKISNSKGKVYQFEIESLFGNDSNAVEISSQRPVLFTAYQPPKEEIVGSKKRIATFIIKKTLSSFTNAQFIFSSITYLLPLLIYIFWRIIIKKYSSTRIFLRSILVSLIIIDIFFIKEFYIGILIGLIIFYVGLIKIYKTESNISFIASFFIIFLWITQTFLNINYFSNKLNTWAYALFVIGVIQLLFEFRTKIKTKIKTKIHREIYSRQ